MQEPVYRVRTADGTGAYVRPDDGSGLLLRQLYAGSEVPVPGVIEARDGWLLLTALPGVPLSDPVWRVDPPLPVSIAAEALRRLEAAEVTHGDLCLPNILGDPRTRRLTGIVDWRYAGRYAHEMDVASTVWSFRYNGYPVDIAVAFLGAVGWHRIAPSEVARLGALWKALDDRSGRPVGKDEDKTSLLRP